MPYGLLRYERPMPLSDALSRTDDASELSPSGPYRAVKQFGLVLLCIAWILLGLFGHDPWKPEDATGLGIAYDMIKQGDWIVPHLAGTPVPDRPPLFYALAGAAATVFRGFFPPPDGARIAVGFAVGATMRLLSLPGREIYGRASRWLPVPLFIGS